MKNKQWLLLVLLINNRPFEPGASHAIAIVYLEGVGALWLAAGNTMPTVGWRDKPSQGWAQSLALTGPRRARCLVRPLGLVPVRDVTWVTTHHCCPIQLESMFLLQTTATTAALSHIPKYFYSCLEMFDREEMLFSSCKTEPALHYVWYFQERFINAQYLCIKGDL